MEFDPEVAIRSGDAVSLHEFDSSLKDWKFDKGIWRKVHADSGKLVNTNFLTVNNYTGKVFSVTSSGSEEVKYLYPALVALSETVDPPVTIPKQRKVKAPEKEVEESAATVSHEPEELEEEEIGEEVEMTEEEKEEAINAQDFPDDHSIGKANREYPEEFDRDEEEEE